MQYLDLSSSNMAGKIPLGIRQFTICCCSLLLLSGQYFHALCCGIAAILGGAFDIFPFPNHS